MYPVTQGLYVHSHISVTQGLFVSSHISVTQTICTQSHNSHTGTICTWSHISHTGTICTQSHISHTDYMYPVTYQSHRDSMYTVAYQSHILYVPCHTWTMYPVTYQSHRDYVHSHITVTQGLCTWSHISHTVTPGYIVCIGITTILWSVHHTAFHKTSNNSQTVFKDIGHKTLLHIRNYFSKCVIFMFVSI